MFDRRYLDTRQAAQYMGLSASWLAHARLRGEGPTWIQIPGSRIVKYEVSDLDDWLSAMKVPGGRPLQPPTLADSAPRRRGRPTKAETIARRDARPHAERRAASQASH